MKRVLKIFIIGLYAFIVASAPALAGWEDTFLLDYAEKGLNAAVINALAEGVAPSDIIVTGMAIEDMDGKVLTAAICDAGIAVPAMQKSLPVLKITQETAIAICEEISLTNRFPGSQYSSASKRTNYDGSSNIIPPPPPPPVPPRPPEPVQPASGHTFN